MAAEWRLLGTTVSLLVIWLAVLFVGVFGGDIVSETNIVSGTVGARTAVPVVVVVALLAVVATLFVTWFAYRSEKVAGALRTDLAEEPVGERGSAPARQSGSVATGHG